MQYERDDVGNYIIKYPGGVTTMYTPALTHLRNGTSDTISEERWVRMSGAHRRWFKKVHLRHFEALQNDSNS